MIKANRKAVVWAMALAALTVPGAAGAAKGLGPYYSIQYESLGIIDDFVSSTGKLRIMTEEIQTVNCAGCDTQYLAPGAVIHVKNLTKKPLCFAIVFKPTRPDGRREQWGSGTAYYLKGGKTAKQVAGLFYINGGDLTQTNLQGEILNYTWEPNANKTCPKVKLG